MCELVYACACVFMRMWKENVILIVCACVVFIMHVSISSGGCYMLVCEIEVDGGKFCGVYVHGVWVMGTQKGRVWEEELERKKGVGKSGKKRRM